MHIFILILCLFRTLCKAGVLLWELYPTNSGSSNIGQGEVSEALLHKRASAFSDRNQISRTNSARVLEVLQHHVLLGRSLKTFLETLLSNPVPLLVTDVAI